MGAVTRAPAHLVGQSIGLPGRHLLLIVRVPKHAAQGGGVLQTEERPAVITVPKTRLGAAGAGNLPQAACAHGEAPGTSWEDAQERKRLSTYRRPRGREPTPSRMEGCPPNLRMFLSTTCSWGTSVPQYPQSTIPHLLYLSPGMGDPVSIRQKTGGRRDQETPLTGFREEHVTGAKAGGALNFRMGSTLGDPCQAPRKTWDMVAGHIHVDRMGTMEPDAGQAST